MLTGDMNVCVLLFTDDVRLLDKNPNGLWQTFHKVHEAAWSMDLKINVSINKVAVGNEKLQIIKEETVYLERMFAK